MKDKRNRRLTNGLTDGFLSNVDFLYFLQESRSSLISVSLRARSVLCLFGWAPALLSRISFLSRLSFNPLATHRNEDEEVQEGFPLNQRSGIVSWAVTPGALGIQEPVIPGEPLIKRQPMALGDQDYQGNNEKLCREGRLEVGYLGISFVFLDGFGQLPHLSQSFVNSFFSFLVKN